MAAQVSSRQGEKQQMPVGRKREIKTVGAENVPLNVSRERMTDRQLLRSRPCSAPEPVDNVQVLLTEKTRADLGCRRVSLIGNPVSGLILLLCVGIALSRPCFCRVHDGVAGCVDAVFLNIGFCPHEDSCCSCECI